MQALLIFEVGEKQMTFLPEWYIIILLQSDIYYDDREGRGNSKGNLEQFSEWEQEFA